MSAYYGAVIAELSKPGGWHKGSIGAYEQDEGAVCLLGALCRVELQDGHTARDNILNRIIAEQFPARVDRRGLVATIPAFNDHPDTMLDDVILVCEKARAES